MENACLKQMTIFKGFPSTDDKKEKRLRDLLLTCSLLDIPNSLLSIRPKSARNNLLKRKLCGEHVKVSTCTQRRFSFEEI